MLGPGVWLRPKGIVRTFLENTRSLGKAQGAQPGCLLFTQNLPGLGRSPAMHLSLLRPGILIELLGEDMGQWSKRLLCRDPYIFYTSVRHTLIF